MAHVSYDVLECELEVMIHDRVGQVKTRVGEDLPKDLLPPLVTLESNHPAKQPFVRVEAEDGATQNVIQELVDLFVVVIHDYMPSKGEELLTDVHVHSVLLVRGAQSLGSTRKKELPWYEEVVGDCVGR